MDNSRGTGNYSRIPVAPSEIAKTEDELLSNLRPFCYNLIQFAESLEKMSLYRMLGPQAWYFRKL
jgi:hypothetical protein